MFSVFLVFVISSSEENRLKLIISFFPSFVHFPEGPFFSCFSFFFRLFLSSFSCPVKEINIRYFFTFFFKLSFVSQFCFVSHLRTYLQYIFPSFHVLPPFYFVLCISSNNLTSIHFSLFYILSFFSVLFCTSFETLTWLHLSSCSIFSFNSQLCFSFPSMNLVPKQFYFFFMFSLVSSLCFLIDTSFLLFPSIPSILSSFLCASSKLHLSFFSNYSFNSQLFFRTPSKLHTSFLLFHLFLQSSALFLLPRLSYIHLSFLSIYPFISPLFFVPRPTYIHLSFFSIFSFLLPRLRNQ